MSTTGNRRLRAARGWRAFGALLAKPPREPRGLHRAGGEDVQGDRLARLPDGRGALPRARRPRLRPLLPPAGRRPPAARDHLARATAPGACAASTLPTVVIHGTADPLVRPAAGRATARAIPGARLRADRGHGPRPAAGSCTTRFVEEIDATHAGPRVATALLSSSTSRPRAGVRAHAACRGSPTPSATVAMRLDAIARWLQDVAYADLLDAGFEQRGDLDRAPGPDAGRVVPAVRRGGDAAHLLQRDRALLGRAADVDPRRDGGGRRGRALGLDRRRAGARRGSRSGSSSSTARAPPGRGAPVRLRHPEPPPDGERTAVDLPRRRRRRRRPRQQLPLLGAARGGASPAPTRRHRRSRSSTASRRRRGRRSSSPPRGGYGSRAPRARSARRSRSSTVTGAAARAA